LTRILARLPIQLYRVGLGPVLGPRMMLLTHTGRVSGRPRHVVVEVVAHDTASGSWTIASGYGPQAQWYRNLRHSPGATVQTGRRRHHVSAYFLDPEEGAEVMAEYAPRNPRAARLLCRYLGLPCDGTPDGYRAAGRQIPFVRLVEYPAR
jgi:deazaflavin-dependent oxidoreductase (nitroreductase family)